MCAVGLRRIPIAIVLVRGKCNARNLITVSALFFYFDVLPVRIFHFCFFINYVDELSLLFTKFYVGAVRGRVPNEWINTDILNVVRPF